MVRPPLRVLFVLAFLVATLTVSPLARIAAVAQSATIALPDFVADRAALSKSLPGADVDAIGADYVVVTPAAFAPPDPSSDSRYNWHFSQSAGIYALRTEGGGPRLSRIVIVHYQPADRTKAQRTCRLLARLLALHRSHFGRDATFHLTDETADVYLAQELSPDGAAIGGETRGNQVYIYGAEAIPRSPIEWVRTIAHEWGHLTLAAARGFREPENDAAGYLGERIYIKWLRSDEARWTAGGLDDGTTPADLDLYDHRQIQPLMDRYTAGGPGSPLLDGATSEAMDYYIGAVLQTDDAYGSAIAGKALDTVNDVHPRNFLIALRRIVTDSESFTVRPPAWIPLARGRYMMAVSIGAAKSGASKLTVSATGWRHMDGIDRDRGTLTFRHVSDHTR